MPGAFTKGTRVKIHTKDGNHFVAGNRINGMYPSSKYHVEKVGTENNGKTYIYNVYPRGTLKTRERHSYGHGYNE